MRDRRLWKIVGGFLLLFSVALYQLQSNPTPRIQGKYSVEGTLGDGKALTGQVRIKVYKQTGKIRVFGQYFLKENREQIARFSSKARFDGQTLRFFFYVRKTMGVVNMLSSLARGDFDSVRRIKVEAVYTLQPDGKTWKGGWRAKRNPEFSTQETWSKIQLPIRIYSVRPEVLEVSSEMKVEMTIRGRNLPYVDEIKPDEIRFFHANNGGRDEALQVVDILEADDEGRTLKVLVQVAADALEGKRNIHVRRAVGRNILTIERGTVKIPLGRSAKFVFGDKVRIFIPQEGGKLKLSGVSGIALKYNNTGEPLRPNDKGEFEIQKAGWYYLDFSEANASGTLEVSSQYEIFARTPEEKTPWNFWYFPFLQKWNPRQNLYSDGGTYEKLDKIFKIQGEEDGWKRFKPYNHMDNDYFKYEDSRIVKLAEKYYKGREWQKPENEADFEFLKKHNPTTIKGYAWCYARSEDPKKSWWGHCWGAVVASSLWAQPEAKTIELENGEKVHFSEEEVEGIITAYYTNHSIYPINYMNDCPPGRPTEELKEKVDRYCDDFFLGLIDGILKKGVPLASNLRAESTDEAKKDQVWNHVIWKFRAKMKEVADQNDETYVEIELEVYATSDIFPSSRTSSPRKEVYRFRLKYNQDGSIDRDNLKYQNWTYAKHFCPSYLWRITRSADPNGTENAVLRGKIDKLVQFFGYKRIR